MAFSSEMPATPGGERTNHAVMLHNLCRHGKDIEGRLISVSTRMPPSSGAVDNRWIALGIRSCRRKVRDQDLLLVLIRLPKGYPGEGRSGLRRRASANVD